MWGSLCANFSYFMPLQWLVDLCWGGHHHIQSTSGENLWTDWEWNPGFQSPQASVLYAWSLDMCCARVPVCIINKKTRYKNKKLTVCSKLQAMQYSSHKEKQPLFSPFYVPAMNYRQKSHFSLWQYGILTVEFTAFILHINIVLCTYHFTFLKTLQEQCVIFAIISQFFHLCLSIVSSSVLLIQIHFLLPH